MSTIRSLSVRRGRVTLTAVSALVALAALCAPSSLAAQGQAAAANQVTVTRGWPLDRDGLVKMFNPNGRVRVIGWDRDSIAVTGTVSKGTTFFGGGSRRGVKFGAEAMGAPAWADLTVRVPAGAVVWVRGAATDITVEGLTGGVDVGCVSGQVRITGDPRELAAEAMDGLVEIIGSPTVLRANTATGALLWTGHAEDATLGSVSGRIEATRGPLGRLRIETISGNVTLDAALGAAADVVIESHSGIVDLRVASTSPARLSVDAPRIVYDGPGRAPPPPPGGKRPGPRTIDLFGAPAASLSAAITVRSFKGEVRVSTPPVAAPK